MPASRLAKVFFAIAFIAAGDIFDVPDQQTSLLLFATTSQNSEASLSAPHGTGRQILCAALVTSTPRVQTVAMSRHGISSELLDQIEGPIEQACSLLGGILPMGG